jgi:hypothetical protein
MSEKKYYMCDMCSKNYENCYVQCDKFSSPKYCIDNG